MKKRCLFPFMFVALLILSSCGGSSSESSSSSDQATDETSSENVNKIIDIKTIVGKTLAEVEGSLGKAESTEKVTGYPCKNSDCEKAFFKNGDYEIIFKDSKADRITINNTPNLASNDDAIQALGLSSTEPSFKNPGNVIKWSGVEGLNEISVFPDYILVQVSQPE